MKLSSVEGNRQWLDGGSMFGNAPRAVWEKWTEVDSLGRIPLACRCLLIETDNQKILCEAGIGAFFEPKLAERFGVQNPDRHLLLENLESLGHSPESIDYVILSHLHFDHAG
ncbi:MAG: MBL fold metallo-hydrolase, partial [Pseudomonadota bacterium]